ncbi:hypothetical protein AGMMS50230_22610 [Spirochaetia bacterium]|nr:hypothetical protein AGMMS50230_22610 [Spirochaetia bacterium]
MTNENAIQMNLKLKITNFKKLNLLENSIKPIINLNFNNKKYIARGQLVFLSTFPKECDYMFPLNVDGKIEFFEDKIIDFLGFENK